MTLAMMNTHKAFKALQLAGVSDQQAEAMVEIFTEMQQDNALSRADLMKAGEGITGSIKELDLRSTLAIKELDDRLSTAIRELDIRITNMDIRLSGEIKALDVRLTRVEARLDRIEKDIEVIKADVSALKTDMRWIKRLLMVMATTMVIAAIKYIFS
jgi:chromosome segregation ATPase